MDDIEFMKSPDKWPLGNVCPIKRRSTKGYGMPQCAFLITADGINVSPVVYTIEARALDNRVHGRMEGNAFSITASENNPRTGGDKLPATEIARFETFEEMVKAGWIVD